MPKPPAHEIRIGLIKGTIWRNQTKNGTNYGVTFLRLFKNGNEWKESARFGRDDLLLVAKVADLAHSWIVAQQQGGLIDQFCKTRSEAECDK